MPSIASARVLATAAVVAGAGFLGASIGGMASVDRELAAAVPDVRTTQLERVAYTPEAVKDCPEWQRDDATTRPEL